MVFHDGPSNFHNHKSYIFANSIFYCHIFFLWSIIYVVVVGRLESWRGGRKREELRRRCTNSKSFFFQKSKRKEVFYSHAQKVAVKLWSREHLSYHRAHSCLVKFLTFSELCTKYLFKFWQSQEFDQITVYYMIWRTFMASKFNSKILWVGMKNFLSLIIMIIRKLNTENIYQNYKLKLVPIQNFDRHE